MLITSSLKFKANRNCPLARLILLFLLVSCATQKVQKQAIVKKAPKITNIFAKNFEPPKTKGGFLLLISRVADASASELPSKKRELEKSINRIRKLAPAKVLILGNESFPNRSLKPQNVLYVNSLPYTLRNFSYFDWIGFKMQKKFNNFSSYSQLSKTPILASNLIELKDFSIGYRWKAKSRLINNQGLKVAIVGVSIPLDCVLSSNDLLFDDPVKTLIRENNRLRNFNINKKIFLINISNYCKDPNKLNRERLQIVLDKLNGLPIAAASPVFVNLGTYQPSLPNLKNYSQLIFSQQDQKYFDLYQIDFSDTSFKQQVLKTQ